MMINNSTRTDSNKTKRDIRVRSKNLTRRVSILWMTTVRVHHSSHPRERVVVVTIRTITSKKTEALGRDSPREDLPTIQVDNPSLVRARTSRDVVARRSMYELSTPMK